MDIVTIAYIIIGVMFYLTLNLTVLVIAGKDIWLAIKRFFIKTGNFVYIVNSNRNISKYYLRPKDNLFRINKFPYMVNPEKAMDLSHFDKIRLIESMKLKEKRLNLRISEIEHKINVLNVTIQQTKDQNLIYTTSAEIERLKGVLVSLQDKLNKKVNQYFLRGRSTYFYIEGDCIAKDFHEFYSLIDGQILDNVIARSISKPVKPQDQTQMTLIFVLIIVIVIIMIVIIFMMYKQNGSINQICGNMGLNCKMFK
jgi:hypothetical protein